MFDQVAGRVSFRLIFDLDETLIDSVPSLTAAANVMLGELGRAPVEPARYKSFVGHGMRQQVKRVLEATGGIPGGDLRPHLARMIAIYGADALRGTGAYPGVLETLHKLAEQGYQMAVCTQKPEAQARQILQGLHLMPPIQGLTGGGTLDVLKPDPAMLHHAAAQLSGDGPVVMIGDRDVDAQTAANAGARFVLFAPDGQQPAFATDATFSDWADLPAVLSDLRAKSDLRVQA